MKKLLLIIVLLILGGAAVWLGTRYKPTSSGSDSQTSNTATGSVVAPAPGETALTSRVFRHRERAKTGEADPMAIWDKQIEEVLASKATDAEIADKLLALYPQVPTEGQADLMQEITTHISNDDYSKMSGILTNAITPVDVLDVMLIDLMTRPDNIHLPLLLEVARIKDNPKSEEAHDFLEVIIGDNYGDDWETWSKKIAEWIASHPDER